MYELVIAIIRLDNNRRLRILGWSIHVVLSLILSSQILERKFQICLDPHFEVTPLSLLSFLLGGDFLLPTIIVTIVLGISRLIFGVCFPYFTGFSFLLLFPILRKFHRYVAFLNDWTPNLAVQMGVLELDESGEGYYRGKRFEYFQALYQDLKTDKVAINFFKTANTILVTLVAAISYGDINLHGFQWIPIALLIYGVLELYTLLVHDVTKDIWLSPALTRTDLLDR
jgi:hypothetical protein